MNCACSCVFVCVLCARTLWLNCACNICHIEKHVFLTIFVMHKKRAFRILIRLMWQLWFCTSCSNYWTVWIVTCISSVWTKCMVHGCNTGKAGYSNGRCCWRSVRYMNHCGYGQYATCRRHTCTERGAQRVFTIESNIRNNYMYNSVPKLVS